MKKCTSSRRTFLKSSAVGMAGVAAGSLTAGKARAKTGGWTENMQINPNIDNLRVAMIQDLNIMPGTVPSVWSPHEEMNKILDSDLIHENMDAMARYLAQSPDTDAAWETIFQKPAAKTWAQVTVAMKVNCVSQDHQVKSPIVEKVCLELNKLGVPFSSMLIFDGGATAFSPYGYSPLMGGNGLPDGVQVSKYAQLLGGNDKDSGTAEGRASFLPVHIPAPYDAMSSAAPDLAVGMLDMLINFSVNKGHDSTAVGLVTLSMKNHLGCINPRRIHDRDRTDALSQTMTDQDRFDYLIGINKSDPIIGGTPARQQLVIVDSIYGMIAGPDGTPDMPIGSILMGTFGPAVDYATIKLIREPVLSAQHTDFAEKYLTSFGYTEDQRDDFIDKTPEENNGLGVGIVTKDYSGVKYSGKKGSMNFHLQAGKYKSRTVKVNFPVSEEVVSVSIYNGKGTLVRRLSKFGDRGITWDGKTSSGSYVSRGTYLAQIQGRSRSASCKVAVN